MTRLKISAVLWAALWATACAPSNNNDPAAAAQSASQPSLPGDSRESIRQLPDWSGVWVLHEGVRASYDAYQTDLNLTPEYQKIRADARAERRQANLSTCLPAGATAVLQHATLFEVLFTPGRVTLLFEDGEIRRIHTDGRAHRPLDELTESFMGDSIGHWDGDTLVVDTIGFPFGELWQNYGVRATLNTTLVERIRLNEKGLLQIDNVMTDPAIFTQPYIYTREYKHSVLALEEPVCVQNNRDDGSHIDLTPPAA